MLLHRGEYIHEHSNILGRIICVALHVLFFSSFIVYVIKSNIPLLRALSVISFEQLECGSNFCNSGHPPRKFIFQFYLNPFISRVISELAPYVYVSNSLLFEESVLATIGY